VTYEGFSLDPEVTVQHFEDILPGSTFYDYIETLYNRGVVVGYPCGGVNPQTDEYEPCVPPLYRPYFRQNNDVTRGEVAKMIVETAQDEGWFCGHNSLGGPDFWDVEPGSTFYDYIEKLYNAGAVQYRVEEPSLAGQGGHFYVGWAATRAEAAMFLHEIVYSLAPPPPNSCR
jgi:hypothetical protein